MVLGLVSVSVLLFLLPKIKGTGAPNRSCALLGTIGRKAPDHLNGSISIDTPRVIVVTTPLSKNDCHVYYKNDKENDYDDTSITTNNNDTFFHQKDIHYFYYNPSIIFITISISIGDNITSNQEYSS